MISRFHLLGALMALLVCGAAAQTASPSGNSSPPTQIEGSGVYRVGGDVTPPKATYAPDPSYSEAARQATYQGTVVLWLVVSAEGIPERIKVQRALGMGLDEEAIRAVKQWRFEPATKDGKPVPVMINVEVNFTLYLSPHPDSASHPPRFPGVNISEYPLLIGLDASNSRRQATGNTRTYKVALVEAGQQQSVSISCKFSSSDCLGLYQGNYPAKWQQDKSTIEILGLGYSKDNRPTWAKAVYTIAAAKDLQAPAEGTAPVNPRSSATGGGTTGQSEPQDYQQLRERYEKEAAAGDATAMNNLGTLYYYGHGVPQDYSKAREWYEKAAAAGNAAAMRNVGLLYHNGQGVPQDYGRPWCGAKRRRMPAMLWPWGMSAICITRVKECRRTMKRRESGLKRRQAPEMIMQ